jgi:hypothetical protein
VVAQFNATVEPEFNGYNFLLFSFDLRKHHGRLREMVKRM